MTFLIAHRCPSLCRTHTDPERSSTLITTPTKYGSTVVVADAAPGRTLGVYRGRRHTPLPWPKNAVGAAW
jgi:hypothetical protein